MNQPSQQNQQIQIKASDEALRGVYSNMMNVVHTPEEFMLDFLNIFPPAGALVSRVIVSPGHMKRLVAALAENVKRYEAQFGEIKVSAGPEENFGSIGFQSRD